MKKFILKLAAATIMIFVSLSNVKSDNAPLWMRYPAISPNGEFIAFCYKGDIYKVPSKGGEAIQLTSNPAYDYMPVWSPDGSHIAFASNRYGNFDIYVVSASGGEPQRLTYHSANEIPSCFSPDGKEVIFSANIQDSHLNVLFPSRILGELYSVPITGGEINQILTTPAEYVNFSPDGNFLAYTDRKGYEDIWRKHHKSSVTRDIWIYNIKEKTHKKITNFEGEDRNAVFSPDGKTLYYLTEQTGSFNIASMPISGDGESKILSNFDKHPVRFLSVDNKGTLCFHYNGGIYTMLPGESPSKVNITIRADRSEPEYVNKTINNGATEISISPKGKELALIIRGDIYVTSTDYSTTKRITNTPEQERSVSFSPDGKKLIYAAERNGSWNIYQTSIVSEEEPNFTLSTLLKEELIVDIPEEAFQPAYSPDGKEVAFLKERTTLCVKNLETGKIRTILDGKYNYSYRDGDQWYQWSPDGKWFAVNFMEVPSWPNSDVALVKADGSGEFFNLTPSGYEDNSPKWAMNGNAIIWFNDQMGMRSHGSWGSEFDVYAIFLNQKTFEEFKLPKIEWEILKEKEKEEQKSNEKEKEKSKKAKRKNLNTNNKSTKPIEIDFDGIEERKVRLTINSSNLSDAILTPDGDKLYYLSKFEKGYDLWVNELKDNKTKLLVKIDGDAGYMQMDKDQKYIYLLSDGKPMKINISNNKLTTIKFSADQTINPQGEREYLFEHMWRQVSKKFYDTALHGTDWEFYKKEYKRFLPHINNNFDFSEMMSELLGELNGSHTGCRYYYRSDNADQTASLGIFIDFNYKGKGIRIAEVIENSPLISSKFEIKAGCIIEKIDGNEILTNSDYFRALNRKKGKQTLVEIFNPATGKRWSQIVKPISLNEESNLLYKNWVKKRAADVERLSNGRIGYVHVKGMNSESFRKVYADLLGKYRDKEAVIVDTRFNGGGWLHDDLATLLSGKRYVDYVPRGQYIGSEPISKWYKPSIVLVSEGNYSDAHGFPFVYKTLKIGKLVGMPVPGTMTAVWWERLIDPSLVFGIPQMGVKALNGEYLENHQLYPDIQVSISPEDAATGIDTQIKAAVEELLKQLK
ncbi:S41 family peptidase [Tenuifilum thalassicum]|uniref:Tricorn protease homolog n=1 Tax=Tenuifilum thalassicum TaxID=2590900 RepID=A0A7D3XK25_9BACT|nr:S41 family peptidase [Tenuifilum thalassicum]QKG79095.1 peptidase S41 [Tenuifilum thalassicum]